MKLQKFEEYKLIFKIPETWYNKEVPCFLGRGFGDDDIKYACIIQCKDQMECCYIDQYIQDSILEIKQSLSTVNIQQIKNIVVGRFQCVCGKRIEGSFCLGEQEYIWFRHLFIRDSYLYILDIIGDKKKVMEQFHKIYKDIMASFEFL